MKSSVRRALKFVLGVVALVFVSPLLYFLGVLAWIAYRPLPHIPRYHPKFTVTDSGLANLRYAYSPFTDDPLKYGWRLTDGGQIVHLTETATAHEEAIRKSAEAKAEQQMGLMHYSRHATIAALAPNGDALVNDNSLDQSYHLWHKSKLVTAMPLGVQGYTWQIWDKCFFKMTQQDITIGNGRIATAYASSGGTSNPHGRWMALIWRDVSQKPCDLNSLISMSDHWYLDQTVDINGRGQILCLGRLTNERGAEKFDRENMHWLILTPEN